MIFQSKHNPDHYSGNNQLVILCHAQDRVLLPLPASFEDAQAVARREFSLSGDLILETDDLLGSDGLHVRIHPAAWETVRRILHTVHVKLAHISTPPPSRPRPSEAVSSGSRRISSQKRISMVGATPVRLSSAQPASVPPPERHSLNARKGLSSSPRPSVLSTHKDMISAASTPRSRPHSPLPPAKPAVIEPAAKIEEVLDADADEEDEELQLLSPKKKRAVRPRIMSDYGVDTAPEDDEGTDALDDDAEFVSSVAGARPSSRAPTPSALSRSGSGSLVELDGFSGSGSGARRPGPSSSTKQLDAPFEDQPKVKTEKVKGKVAAPQADSQPPPPPVPQSQPGAEESFLIMIEYSDNPDSRSLFKTRGRHTVSKVLMQACRTFGVEEFYRNAQLVLIEEEDDDGEIVY